MDLVSDKREIFSFGVFIFPHIKEQINPKKNGRQVEEIEFERENDRETTISEEINPAPPINRRDKDSYCPNRSENDAIHEPRAIEFASIARIKKQMEKNEPIKRKKISNFNRQDSPLMGEILQIGG